MQVRSFILTVSVPWHISILRLSRFNYTAPSSIFASFWRYIRYFRNRERLMGLWRGLELTSLIKPPEDILFISFNDLSRLKKTQSSRGFVRVLLVWDLHDPSQGRSSVLGDAPDLGSCCHPQGARVDGQREEASGPSCDFGKFAFVDLDPESSVNLFLESRWISPSSNYAHQVFVN